MYSIGITQFYFLSKGSLSRKIPTIRHGPWITFFVLGIFFDRKKCISNFKFDSVYIVDIWINNSVNLFSVVLLFYLHKGLGLVENPWGQFHPHAYKKLLCAKMLYWSTSISSKILCPTFPANLTRSYTQLLCCMHINVRSP